MPRIVYQNWIVELGHDPATPWDQKSEAEKGHNQAIIEAVNCAFKTLGRNELLFIRLYYMQGMSYQQISEITGKADYRLESIHKIAVKKLKRSLYRLLGGKYNIPPPDDPACPLCTHRESKAVDDLIRTKTEQESWKRIIRKLREDFGIVLPTIQRLIGHYKYHLK